MFVNDQPIAPDIAVNVSDSNGEINWLTLCVVASDTLNAMAEAHRSISSYAQVADFDIHWPLEHAEKVCPVLGIRLGSNILTWWNHIEHEKAFVRHVDFHNGIDILGIDSGDEATLKRPDTGFIIGRRPDTCQRHAKCHGKHESSYSCGGLVHFLAPRFNFIFPE